jgi:hypothetical protein
MRVVYYSIPPFWQDATRLPYVPPPEYWFYNKQYDNVKDLLKDYNYNCKIKTLYDRS